MNSIIKPLAIASAVFFILGIFLVTYEFISLPDTLMARSSAIDLNVIQEVQPAINRLFMVVGGSLTLGLAALFLQVLMYRGQGTSVTYVSSPASSTGQAKLHEDDEESHDVSALDETLVAEIQKIAGQKASANEKLEQALRKVCNHLEASQGAVYVSLQEETRKLIELRAGYALMMGESQVVQYEYGEGIAGQAAKEGKMVNLSTVPEGYIQVLSGLGTASPTNLLICPVKAGDKVKGVVEIASFTRFSNRQTDAVKQAFELMGKVFEESSKQPAAQLSSSEEELQAQA